MQLNTIFDKQFKIYLYYILNCLFVNSKMFSVFSYEIHQCNSDMKMKK